MTIVVLTSVLASYVLGAALAAASGSSPWLLFLPAAVLSVSAFLLRLDPASQHGDEPDRVEGS